MIETDEKYEKWDLSIQPRKRWFDLHPQDLWRYRDLIFLFIKRDFVTFYKQTIEANRYIMKRVAGLIAERLRGTIPVEPRLVEQASDTR